jgi:choline-glycine betaine transporter
MLFGSAVVIVLLFVIAGFIFPAILSGITNSCFNFLIKYTGWLYLWSALLLLVFSIAIAISRYGTIRLGGDGDRPEYSLITWLPCSLAPVWE